MGDVFLLKCFSAMILDYFKLFYSDYVFAEITILTNLNAATKRVRGDKGVWTDVTVDEIKAYFGILIIMDTMTFDRDELYWSQSESHWLTNTLIPNLTGLSFMYCLMPSQPLNGIIASSTLTCLWGMYSS
jgi:hypothetical protein